MSKIKINFPRCPTCGQEGKELDSSGMVWYHVLEAGHGAKISFQKHKWSVQTGRMVHTKPDTEDEIW